MTTTFITIATTPAPAGTTCTLAVQGQIDGDVFTWPVVRFLTQRPARPAAAHLERHLLLVLDSHKGAVEPAYPVGDAHRDELDILERLWPPRQ